MKRLIGSNSSRRFFYEASARRFASTLVIAEQENGSLKSSTLNAVAAAAPLGENSKVSLLVAGSGRQIESAAQQASLTHPTISEVLYVDSERFKYPLAEPWAEIIHLAQQKGRFSHIISGSTSFGKNIVPRAAALLNVSPLSDVIKILDESTFIRPIYAGNALCKVRYKGEDPCVLTVRPTSFPHAQIKTDVSKESSASFVALDISSLASEFDRSSKWLGQSSQEKGRVDLASAKVVVSGGRALKSAENFKLLEKLADKLGGAVGATRAAVDAGYVPNDMQVGQTGKIVAPQLYIAIGISGAIQHLAGMKDSKVVVAINKDADAPIFQVADYGIVGDLFEIIPELIEKVPTNAP